MAYILLIAGSVLLVAGVRNQQSNLFTLLKNDLTGADNFFYWIVAVILVGSLGYIDALKPVSHALLILIVLAFVLSNKGFFPKFTQQISQGTSTSNSTSGASASNLGSVADSVTSLATLFGAFGA